MHGEAQRRWIPGPNNFDLRAWVSKLPRRGWRADMVTQLPEQFRFEVVEGELLMPEDVWTETESESLFHYTTASGVFGILDEHNFLLTNFESLNDSSEIVYGLKRIADRLEKLLENEDVHVVQQFDYALARLRDPASSFELDPDFYGKVSVAVFSFSEAENDLAQWRAYSRGGEGYAIQVRREVLKKVLLAEPNSGIVLVKCLYHTEAIERLIDPLLLSFIESARSGGVSNLADNLWSMGLQWAAQIKHEAFAGEREWRLVRPKLLMEEMSSRLVNGRIRAILACTWLGCELELIEKVIIGPHHNAESAAKTLGPLLEQTIKTSRDKIAFSGIPYRTG